MLRPLDPQTGQPFPIDPKSGLPVFKKVTRRPVSDVEKPAKTEEAKPPTP